MDCSIAKQIQYQTKKKPQLLNSKAASFSNKAKFTLGHRENKPILNMLSAK